MSSVPIESLDATDRETLRHAIVDVLRVPLASVHPDADLVYELGAESIDFLDLLFSLDDLVGTHVLPERWGKWIRTRLPADSQGRGITPRVLEDFILHYRREPTLAPAETP